MSVKNIEMNVVRAIKDVVLTYQSYEENFNDAKYSEINEYFIRPLIGRADSLMTAFDNMGQSISALKNFGTLSER